jgi:TonB family protein
MPPTLKDSSTLPTSPENPERSSEIPSAPQTAGSEKPVALEVPVKVNGARAVEGSEKRETFSETTTTVLVLAGGAVIRLSVSVEPGQLLFLTNEKTRKEVVCQVVKSKNYRNVRGYVELEFTEPVLGFWGMRFPGERHTPQSASLPAARTSDSASLSAGISPKSAETKTTPYTDARPAAADVTSNLADVVQEFKTEIKTDSRPLSKADLMAPAEPSIDGLKLEANRLQEQLSALLFAEKQSEGKSSGSVAPASKQELGDAAAKSFDMATEQSAGSKPTTPPAKSEMSSSLPAAPRKMQGPVTSSFDDEEVKIPAWLEPLARNAAIPAPPAEEGESDSATKIEESKTPRLSEPVSSQRHATTPTKIAAPTPRQTPAAPVFGNSLLGETAPGLNQPRGGGKAIWMGIAAGFVIAAAGGGWYFRDSIASLVSAHTALGSGTSNAAADLVSHPAVPPVSSAALATPSLPPVATPESSATATKPNSASAVPGASAPISSSAQGKVQPAAITERIPKASSSGDVVAEPANSVEIVVPEIKKPSLGQVRLAKPKMDRSAKVQANGEMAPTLEGSSGALSLGDNSLGGNFAESSKQPEAPAAPVQVGGDVKPARMISAVPPVYPAMAKAQHVAGDVRIDALIDATGHVTTMKVVSGPPLLHQAAMEALRQWKYQAATLDGKPVPMHLTVTIQFHLQ